MPGNLPLPIPTNNNNTPKVETPSDVVTVNDESDTEEDKNENGETIKDKKRFAFQVNSPALVERCVWEACQNMDYYHNNSLFSNINTQVTATPTSWSTCLPN